MKVSFAPVSARSARSARIAVRDATRRRIAGRERKRKVSAGNFGSNLHAPLIFSAALFMNRNSAPELAGLRNLRTHSCQRQTPHFEQLASLVSPNTKTSVAQSSKGNDRSFGALNATTNRASRACFV